MKIRLWAAAVAAIGMISLACGSSDEVGEHVNPSGASTSIPPQSKEKEEVEGIVKTIWHRLRIVSNAEASWNTCRASTTGYEEIRSCAEKAVAPIEELSKSWMAGVSGLSSFQTSCGQETMKKWIRYVTRRAEHARAIVDWLTKNEKTLRPLLAKKTIAETLPSGYPNDPDGSIGLGAAANLECMAQILGCGQSCSVEQMNRVAGLPSGATASAAGSTPGPMWATIKRPGKDVPDGADARSQYMTSVLTAAPGEPSLDKKGAGPLLEKLRLGMLKAGSIVGASQSSLGADSGMITFGTGVSARLSVRGEVRTFGACSEAFLGTGMIEAGLVPADFAKAGLRGILCKSTGCSAVFDMRPTSSGGGLYGGDTCLSIQDAMKL